MLANLEATNIKGVYKNKTTNTLEVDINQNVLKELSGIQVYGDIKEFKSDNNLYSIIESADDECYIVKNSSVVVDLYKTNITSSSCTLNLDTLMDNLCNVADDYKAMFGILEYLGFDVLYTRDDKVCMYHTIYTGNTEFKYKGEKIRLVSLKDFCISLLVELNKSNKDIKIMLGVSYDLDYLYGIDMLGYKNRYLKDISIEHLLVLDLDSSIISLKTISYGNLVKSEDIKKVNLNMFNIENAKYETKQDKLYLRARINGDIVWVKI